jgi:hypothetical protein
VVGLYAAQDLRAGTEDFSRENIKALIEASGPIGHGRPDGRLTPKTDHAGAFTRTGPGGYQFWAYDNASGAFVHKSDADWDKTICGSPIGGPCA